jgi:hypothetical protein
VFERMNLALIIRFAKNFLSRKIEQLVRHQTFTRESLEDFDNRRAEHASKVPHAKICYE